ncbi:hypothetical protein BaRGS_00025425 [Batillaria attramentaria]|uniref:Uncharacterized protein n=1 Tax=Batillaria attramentaria TaxID=370345 RepID=A0ABD0K8H8_9CAEN
MCTIHPLRDRISLAELSFSTKKMPLSSLKPTKIATILVTLPATFLTRSRALRAFAANTSIPAVTGQHATEQPHWGTFSCEAACP